VLSHRWQSDGGSQPLERIHNREVWRRLRIGGFLLLFVGLLALFVYQLWFRPIQTPLIAISAPAYAWPLPPNAWAQEDLQGLADLDKQESVRLLDASAAWRSVESGLASLDRQLRAASALGSKTGAVIIYVSVHGAVDADGHPALILPSASPLRSETWLKVTDLLERIKAEHLPDEWHKLLILDCNRMSVNWSLGLLANTFADRLQDVVAEKKIPNLVILNSTSPGQTAWASADLSGSVFGHYLRLGLAGAADDPSEGGNGDHRVSLHELRDYLQSHVDAWVRHNRVDHQLPRLIPESAADFTVVWALNKATQRRLADAAPSTSTGSSVTARDLDPLWQARDRLSAFEPLRFDPLAWRDFEQKLLWLEQAAVAGGGYKAPARAALRELQSYTVAVDERAAKLAEEGTIFARADLLTDRETKRPPPTAHTLPLAEFFGMPVDGASQLAAKLAQFQSAPGGAAADALLGGLSARNRGPQWTEVQYLRLMRNELPASVWQRPAIVGKALGVEMRAERLAVPEDERTENWVLPLVAVGDRAAQQAKDRLFAGDSATLAAAEPFWQESDRRYAQAEKVSKSVAAALALRDRAYAEVPYLAAWLARPLPPDESAATFDAEINNSLLPLIHANHALGALLAAGEPAGADTAVESPALDQQARQVRERLEHLEELFAAECTRLQKSKTADAARARDIDAALAVPLAPQRQREELRRLLVQTSAKLSADGTAESAKDNGKDQSGKEKNKQTSPKKSSIPETDAADYLHRSIVEWQEHPALAILATTDNLDKPTDMPHERLGEDKTSHGDLYATSAARGGRVRELLDTLPARLRRLHDVGADSESNESATGAAGRADADRGAQARLAVGDAERLTRAAASLWFPPLDYDPIRRQRQWNLQQLLLWHAARVLDDFWGPADTQGDPLFAVAAADYLRAAQAVGEVEPSLLVERNRLAKLLERRRGAARAAVRVEASDVLLLEENENATIKLGVQATAEAEKQGAPTERVALFVRDAKGRIDGTTQFLDLAAGNAATEQGQRFDLQVPTAALIGRGPMLEAVALLRTNPFVAPFLLRPTGGARIDFKPYNYGPPTVTLAGRSRKRASIIFILDCSNSMSELTDMEGPGGVQRIPRLEAAKIALHEMLAELASEGDARVGVLFYGHRVGWNLKKPDQMLRQTDYARVIPDDLRPSEDVELVLPLGRFDSVVAGGVFDLMKSLKPWGETPLYLSLVQAIGDFANDEPGTEKSIVVITDGANYQFNSPNPKRRDDVMTTMGDRKIPIHIVGFGIPASEQAEAAKEFGALADQTEGSFTPVSSGTTLVKSLETLLGPKVFTVFDGGGNDIGHAQVGSAVTVNPKPNGPHPFTVALGSLTDQIELSGGEAAELVLSADGKSLETVGFDKGDPLFGPLIDGDRGTETVWRLGVHRPIRAAEGVRFPFSVQRADRQFAPRPIESWFEVTPILDEKRAAPAKYVFYDANCEPGTTVPVLNWLAEDWPAGAKQMEVRAWLKFEPTKPDWIVKLGQVANQLPQSGTGTALDGLPGVTYQVRTRRGDTPGSPFRVAVIERHAEDSPGLGSLKVEIYPQPAHVVHRFDAENHLATHLFELDETSEQAVATYELHFTRRENAQKNTLQLAEPITRDVTDSTDVIHTAK
jgi:hypothetical protein